MGSLHRAGLPLQIGDEIGEYVLAHFGRRGILLLFAGQRGIVLVFLKRDLGIVQTTQPGSNGMAAISGVVAITAALLMASDFFHSFLRVIHGLMCRRRVLRLGIHKMAKKGR